MQEAEVELAVSENTISTTTLATETLTSETQPPVTERTERIEARERPEEVNSDDEDDMNIQPFDCGCDSATLGTRFTDWLDLFKNTMIAKDIKDKERLKASLIVSLGNEGRAVYKSIKKPDADSYDEICKAMQEHLKADSCTLSEIIKFRQAYRMDHEDVSEYSRRLRKLSTHCGFGAELEVNLRDQFVTGLGPGLTEAQEKCIRPSLAKTLTLTQAIEISKAIQDSRANIGVLQQQQAAANIGRYGNKINFAGERDSRLIRDETKRAAQGHHNNGAPGAKCKNCSKRAHQVS